MDAHSRSGSAGSTMRRKPVSSLRIRGGGSKISTGCRRSGDILDTTSWRGIVSYEPTELVVVARARHAARRTRGDAAGKKGQCLPFEPPHFGGGATVGGMVAAGLSGPRRSAVGAVRD